MILAQVERGDEFVVVLVGAEQFGQAGARQLVIGGEPIAAQAGEMALPERRGGREREQQRQIGRQPHDQIDAGVDVRHCDVHVHAAQHVAVADHLQVVHDGAVARLRRHDLLRPEGEREGAHGGDAELVLGGGLAERAAIMREMRARFVHAWRRAASRPRSAIAAFRSSRGRRALCARARGISCRRGAPPGASWRRTRNILLPCRSNTCARQLVRELEPVPRAAAAMQKRPPGEAGGRLQH